MKGTAATTSKPMRDGAGVGGAAAVPDLFTLAPFSDMDTSLAAAKAIVPHLERLERKVLEALRVPMSAQELEHVTGLSGNTVRPRLVTLRARGMVTYYAEGFTASGRRCKVWGLTDKGRAALCK